MDEPQIAVKHRKPKKLPVFVSAEDLLAILKVSKHKHHKFAYMMGFYSGLRISEILNLEEQDDILCDKCNSKIDFKFRFKERGYYEKIHSQYPKLNKICEKCYKELKIPFAEIQKMETEIYNKKQKLDELKEKFALHENLAVKEDKNETENKE